MTDRSFLFIINPKAGVGTNHLLEDMIRSTARSFKLEVDVVYTEYKGHGTELAAKAAEEERGAVVAVGGDGTVNEVARAVNGTTTALGIIPAGSGNGLARHHKIPMDPFQALQVALIRNTQLQDSVLINGLPSFNVSGLGLDAHIASRFGNDGKRGFSSYMRLLLSELPGYKAYEYTIRISGREIKGKYLMLSICTASQFGNNARINPEADVTDGLTDIVCVKDVPFYAVPVLLVRAFYGKVTRSRYVTHVRCDKLTIECNEAVPLHIDGETAGIHSVINIVTKPSSLLIIKP
jgi:YegS/Rv2252/BmrU family lipid kinase